MQTNPPHRIIWLHGDWLIALAILTVHVIVALLHKEFPTLGLDYPKRAIWDLIHVIPVDLMQTDFWRSLWVMHAQPPLFNVYSAVFINLFPADFTEVMYHANILMGGMISGMMFVILRELLRSRWTAAVFALLLALNPMVLFYETYLLYSILTVFLVTLTIFWLALYARSRYVTYVYLVIVTFNALMLTRSLFHLALVVPLVLYLCWLAKHQWRRVLLVGVMVSLVTVGWYAKNAVQYGFFGSSSWQGYNLWRIVIEGYPEGEQLLLRDQGVIDAVVAEQPVFTLAGSYVEYGYDKTTDVPMLNRGSNWHQINIPDISQAYFDNAVNLIRHNPWRYLANVYAAYKIYTTPGKPFTAMFDDIHVFYQDSANRYLHLQNIIEPAARLLKIPGVVSILFVWVPFTLVGYAGLLISHRRDWRVYIRQHPVEIPVWLVIGYITVLGIFLEYGENDRFRFDIEQLLWGLGLAVIVRSARERRWWGIGLGLAAALLWVGAAIGIERLLPQAYVYREPIPQTAYEVDDVFEGGLRLLAAEPLPDTYAAGDTIPVTLYWQVLQPLDKPYIALIEVYDTDGTRIAYTERLIGSTIWTNRWDTWQTMRDSYTFDIPQNPPPQLEVVLSVFPYLESGYRAPLIRQHSRRVLEPQQTVVHMQTITLQDAEPVPLVDETLTPLDAVLHDPELGAALHVRGVGYCLEERANGNVGHYQTSPPNPLSDAQRGGEYGSLQDSKSPLHAMERGFRGGVKYLVSLPMNYLHSCPPTITPTIEPPLLRVTVTADALLDFPEDYVFTFTLSDAAGNTVAEQDGITPDRAQWYKTLFMPGQTVRVERDIPIGTNLTPGVYMLRMRVRAFPQMAELAVESSETSVVLGAVVIGE